MATTRAELKAQYSSLFEQAKELETRLYDLYKKKAEVELAIERLDHPCSCVCLNKEIDIWDCREQEAKRRNGFGAGLVADSLSANLDCPTCHGSGVPPTASSTSDDDLVNQLLNEPSGHPHTTATEENH